MSDTDSKNTTPAQQVEIKEIRKGVLNNLTVKPPLPSSVTSSTGQSATTQTPAVPTPAVPTVVPSTPSTQE